MDHNKTAIYQQLKSLKTRAPSRCRCPNCRAEDLGDEKIVDSKGARLHICSYENCNRIFNRTTNLENHVRSEHTNEWPFVCESQDCGKKFQSNEGLRRHLINKHTEEKNHVCHICGFKTAIKSYLKIHVKTRHDQKKLKADYTGIFQGNYQLYHLLQQKHVQRCSENLEKSTLLVPEKININEPEIELNFEPVDDTII